MEQQNQARPTESSLETSRKLHEQRLRWLARKMAEAQARFPHQELPEITKKVYLVDWLEMVREVGEGRFEIALKRALRQGKFFPTPGAIHELIPEPIVSTVQKYEQEPETPEFKAAREAFREKLKEVCGKKAL